MRGSRGITLVVALLLAAPALALSPSPVSAAQPTFDVLPVPTLPGSYGYTVRDAATGGKVVGDAYFQFPNASHPFYFDGTTPVDLGTFGGTFGAAFDVNSSGTVAGVATTESENERAFVWDAGVMTNLGTVGGADTRAVAINEAGQVAGTKRGPNGGLAVVWDDGLPTEIGTLGGDASGPTGITADGVVVGGSNLAPNSVGQVFSHVFVYDGSIHDLGALPGFENNVAMGVTANGLIYGYGEANNRNCPWAQSPQPLMPCRQGWTSDLDGPLKPMQSPSSDPDHYIIPMAANDAGQIVGVYLGDDTCNEAGDTFCEHGFLLDQGVLTTLPGYEHSGGSSSATSINAQGDILGASDGFRFYRDNVGYSVSDVAPDLAEIGFAPYRLADDGVISGTTSQNQLYVMVPSGLDISAPFIDLAAPGDGAVYTLNQPVTVSFSCDDGSGSGVATCAGDQPNGTTLDTSTAGPHSFSVTAADNDGRSRNETHAYYISDGDVTTTVQGSDQGTVVVSTDPSGSGATAEVPIQTSVQFNLPPGQQATVAIDLHVPDVSAPSGYQILGQQVDIDLTGINPANGLTLTFVIDSSLDPDPLNISMARYDEDGTFIFPTCASLIDPENCFEAEFVDGPGGDVRITIMTVHASKWVPVIRVDTTPPSVSPTVTGTLGSAGWYRSNVSVEWIVEDPDSAFSQSGCTASVVSSDTAGTTFTCTATSVGGTTSRSTTVKRDATRPSLTCQPATFTQGATPASVSATVADGLSGGVSPTISGAANLSSVGLKSLTLTGADVAGNTATTSCVYKVGYRVEVLKPATSTPVKRGSTIPIWFKLGDSSGRAISDSAAKAVAMACAAKVSFSGGGVSPDCATYDAKADTFMFDLKTSKALAPGTYVTTIRVYASSNVVNDVAISVSIRI